MYFVVASLPLQAVGCYCQTTLKGRCACTVKPVRNPIDISDDPACYENALLQGEYDNLPLPKPVLSTHFSGMNIR